MDVKRKEQIKFRAGSTRDGLIANCVPTEQAFMYEDGFKDGADWADENPKEGLVNIDKACEYLESAIRPYMGYSATCDFVDSFRKVMEK